MKSLFSNGKLLVLVTFLNLIVGCVNKQNEVQSEPVQVKRVCYPGSTKSQACSISNGSGTQMLTCNSNGSAFEKYGTCTVNSCNSGYFLSDGACLEQTCSPGSTKSQACSISNGAGTQMVTCNSNGSAVQNFGACVANSCNDGYFLNDGSCIAQVCSPGATGTQACSVSNGSGTQTGRCNSNGSAVENYGACVANSCNIGYSLSDGVCAATEPDITAVQLLLLQ